VNAEAPRQWQPPARSGLGVRGDPNVEIVNFQSLTPAYTAKMVRVDPGAFMDVFGLGRDPHRWIVSHMGSGARIWPYRSPFAGKALGLYCQSLADASAFLRAFPEFELVDGTASPVYNSPFVIEGKRMRDQGR